MPKYRLFSDRNNGGTGTGGNAAGFAYFVSGGDKGPLTAMGNSVVQKAMAAAGGVDRGVPESLGVTKGCAWPAA